MNIFCRITVLLAVSFQFKEILNSKIMEFTAKFGAKKVMMLEVLIVDPQYQTHGFADRFHVW